MKENTTERYRPSPPMKSLLKYRLIKTKRRLTFEILDQNTGWWIGKTDDDFVTFKATNEVEVISRSRMDIQTDRLWLLGCGPDERSGSMVFSSDEKRDRMFDMFQNALMEWADELDCEDRWSEYDEPDEVSPIREQLDKDTFEIKVKIPLYPRRKLLT